MPDSMSNREPADDRLLAEAIAAIGKSTAGPVERDWFENWFRALRREALARLPGLEADDVSFRDALRDFLVDAERLWERRRRLKPFEHEIARVRYYRLNKMPAVLKAAAYTPGTLPDPMYVLKLLTDPGLLARAERIEADDIRFLLENSDDYRKNPVRKAVIEPLLAMLRDEGVISEDMVAPRELPLSRMVETTLDYVGFDQTRRPTKLTAIINYIKSLEKHPAKHPTD